MNLKRSRGFTLIELMIVIAILGIIATIALPSFLAQIQQARRSDAKQSLLDVAAKLEQFYQDNKGYPTASNMGLVINGAGATFTSPEGYYTISFKVAPTATTYTIQAVPTASQTDDTDCYSFVLDELGNKTNWKVDGTTQITNDRCW